MGYVLINSDGVRMAERPDMTAEQAADFNRVYKLFGDTLKWVPEWRGPEDEAA